MNDLIVYGSNNSITQRTAEEKINLEPFIDSFDECNKNLRSKVKESTLTKYKSGILRFKVYCSEKNTNPELLDDKSASYLIGFFVTDLAKDGLNYNTIALYRAGIKFFYENIANPIRDVSPTTSKHVTDVMNGIKNRTQKKPVRRTPLKSSHVTRMIEKCDIKTIKGLRDRAIIAMCFCGAFRRSEVASMRIDNLERDNEQSGYRYHSMDSKGGELSKGVMSGEKIPLFDYIDAYLNAAGITEGYMFYQTSRTGNLLKETKGSIRKSKHINDREINKIIKRYAEMIGENPRLIGGHSTRRGMATEAVLFGHDTLTVMDLLGHKNSNTTKIYVDEAIKLKKNAGKGIV
jgi:site-specific recombinase XerD